MSKKQVELYLKNAVKDIHTPEFWNEIENIEPVSTQRAAQRKKHYIMRYSVATAACIAVLCMTTTFISKNAGVSPELPITNNASKVTQISDNIIINDVAHIEQLKINARIQDVSFEQLQNTLSVDLSVFNDNNFKYSLLFGNNDNALLGALIVNEENGSIITLSINSSFDVYDILLENPKFSSINNQNVAIFKNGNEYVAKFVTEEATFYVENNSLDQINFVSYLKEIL